MLVNVICVMGNSILLMIIIGMILSVLLLAGILSTGIMIVGRVFADVITIRGNNNG